MHKKELTELLERYRLGQCTSDELRLLHQTFNKVPLSDSFQVDADELHSLQQQAEAEFYAVSGQNKRTPVWIRRVLPYAAALAVALTVGLYLFVLRQTDHERLISASEILPATHQATLTLENGDVISLSETHEGIVINDNGITYNDGDKSIVDLASEKADKVVLSTPKGRTYSVILSDGSKVWLNALSTLTYPAKFTGNERVVEISGEALFSVAKDTKRPFKVVSKDQQIEVLGTEFNISAYPDDNFTATTLINGHVKVAVNDTRGTLLKPGEQAINTTGGLRVQSVDTTPYIAWKDGFFYFKRLPLESALAQLARWYDIQVVYEGEKPQVNLFAELDRKLPLGSVLKSLERSGLQFKLVRAGTINQLVVLGELTKSH